METLGAIIPYIQIALSILLVAAVILQQTGAGLGGAFGGDNFSSGFHTRRGFEKTLFHATVTLAILFVAAAFLNLIIR